MVQTATWMDLEILILRDVNKSEKDRYHMILLVCEPPPKKRLQVNVPTIVRVTDVENKLIVMGHVGNWNIGTDSLSLKD